MHRGATIIIFILGTLFVILPIALSIYILLNRQSGNSSIFQILGTVYKTPMLLTKVVKPDGSEAPEVTEFTGHYFNGI
jgi:hypothetical protein